MMIGTMAQDRDHSVTVGYEIPPHSRAAERHGPYHLVRDDGGGIRITGVYRTIWGAWRRTLRLAAVVGLGLLLFGALVDSVLRRDIVIDLRQVPPVFTGSAATLIGFALLVIVLLTWLLFRAVTWRRLHRLEIEAGPDELIVRQTLPTGEQRSGRWKIAEVEQIVAEQYELIVRPREGGPLKIIIGGPWTAAFWLVERMGQASGIATASVGRTWQ